MRAGRALHVTPLIGDQRGLDLVLRAAIGADQSHDTSTLHGDEVRRMVAART